MGRDRRRAVGMALLLAMALVLPSTATAGAESGKAAPVIGRDFRISGKATTTPQDEAAVAWSAAEQAYLVVWTDSRNDFQNDIYGRLIGSDGKPVGGDTRLSGPGATGYDMCPDVAWSSTSNVFLVVWQDGRNAYGLLSTEIYGRMVGPDGKPLGPEFVVNGPGFYDSDVCPAVAWASSTNQFLVAWEGNRDHFPRGSDIYGRLVGPDGQPVGAGAFTISGAAAMEDDRNAAVAYGATSDRFLVVWADYRNQATTDCDLYGRWVGVSGAPAGPDFRVSGASSTRDEASPEIAWNDNADQFLVVWEDNRNDATRGIDIYGRLIKGGGGMASAEKRLSGAKASSDENHPEVAWSPASLQYLVVWQDWRVASADTRGQMLTAGVLRSGSDFRVSGAAGTGYETHPDVTFAPVADPVQYLVVWSDRRNGWDDLYGRRVAG